jgi:hypothetical protein
VLVALAAALFALTQTAGQTDAASTRAPVAEAANVRFYSDELLNLHHTLYAAAWAQRPDAGTRSFAGNLPALLDAPLTPAERAAGTTNNAGFGAPAAWLSATHCASIPELFLAEGGVPSTCLRRSSLPRFATEVGRRRHNTQRSATRRNEMLRKMTIRGVQR